MSDIHHLFKPMVLTLAALDEIDKRVRPTICVTICATISSNQPSACSEGRISEDDYDTLMAVARQFAKMP